MWDVTEIRRNEELDSRNECSRVQMVLEPGIATRFLANAKRSARYRDECWQRVSRSIPQLRRPDSSHLEANWTCVQNERKMPTRGPNLKCIRGRTMRWVHIPVVREWSRPPRLEFSDFEKPIRVFPKWTRLSYVFAFLQQWVLFFWAYQQVPKGLVFCVFIIFEEWKKNIRWWWEARPNSKTSLEQLFWAYPWDVRL